MVGDALRAAPVAAKAVVHDVGDVSLLLPGQEAGEDARQAADGGLRDGSGTGLRNEYVWKIETKKRGYHDFVRERERAGMYNQRIPGRKMCNL